MKKGSPQNDDFGAFKDAFKDVSPLRQDKIHVGREVSKPNQQHSAQQQDDNRASREASFYFSDEYVPHIDTSKTLSYTRAGVPSFEAKQLRRGDFAPDITLDLHGLNRQQSKLELAALIHYCKKQQLQCACIVHGIGSKVLKEKVPAWLVQHPDVRAFHQAPLEWGGDGAILMLLDINE